MSSSRNNLFVGRQRAGLLIVTMVLLSWRSGLTGAEQVDRKQNYEYTADDGSVMVQIRKGEFTMGSPEGEGEDNEHPRHKVSLDDYFIGKYAVTNKQYAAFLNAYGKDKDESGQKMVYENKWGVKNKGGKWSASTGYEKHPVIAVTWYGANQYAKFYGMRLPTEAEWEKAARGGSNVKYSFGDTESKLGEYAWYDQNLDGRTHPVGEKRPNAWGLYDMIGNVWEWCSDWYGFDYYENSPNNNPQGPDGGGFRVFRGGCWFPNADRCRSAYRLSNIPELWNGHLGFRCAVGASDKSIKGKY